jgi:hypothetical protein
MSYTEKYTVVVRSECFDNAILSYLSIMEGDTKCP